jgi:zinc and cadmium transporter
MPVVLIFVYCFLIALSSLFGGWLPALVRLTHTRMQLIMSFVGGFMLGVALLHMLPHAFFELDSIDGAVGATVVGLLAMFCMIRILHVHQHSHDDAIADLDDDHDCQHDHAAPADQETAAGGEHESHEHAHNLSWVGLFAGLAIHTLIDGVALASGVAAGAAEGSTATFLGLSTFFAIFLHKPLDALSIAALMAAAGWSSRSISIANVGFALMCPLGALTFFFGIQQLGGYQHLVLGTALGFSAGVFLCIALADILPEVQFHRHDRLTLTAALIGGIVTAWVIGMFEPEHKHDAEGSHSSHQVESHGHDHDGDEHAGHDHE